MGSLKAVTMSEFRNNQAIFCSNCQLSTTKSRNRIFL